MTIQAYHFDSGALIAQTTTAATGTYRIAPQAPRHYRVFYSTGTTAFVNLARDDRTAQQVSLTPGMEVSKINFDLYPDAIISGQVTATDGTPLPGPRIAVFDPSFVFVAGATADFDGTYKIALPATGAAGGYQIRAEPCGHPLPWQWFRNHGNPTYSFSTTSVVGVGTGQEATVNIRVAPGGSISGRLLSLDNGVPVSAAEVAITGSTTGAFAEVRVRADGTYTAYGPPDTYQVEVRPSADTPFAGSTIQATIAGVEQDTPHIDFVLRHSVSFIASSFTVGATPVPWQSPTSTAMASLTL